MSKPFRQHQLSAMLNPHLRPLAAIDVGTSGGAASLPDDTAPARAGSGIPEPVVLDPQALMRLRELDPRGENRLMQRVTAAFDTSIGRLMPQLRDALKTPDLTAIRHVSHTLKSSSASIGAVKLSKMCAEMESLARQGLSDGMTERVLLLQTEVEAVRVALQRMLDA